MSARVKFPTLGGPSERAVARARKVIADSASAIEVRMAGAHVQCAAYGASPASPIAKPCGEWFPIAQAVWVDEYYWIPPYGCTGGGDWALGEGLFVCPHCGYLNRTYGREDSQGLRRYAARTVTAYRGDSCLRPSLEFKDGGYPFPAHVQARLNAEAAERAAERAQARADHLRARVARDRDRSGEAGQTAKQAGPEGREPGPEQSGGIAQ